MRFDRTGGARAAGPGGEGNPDLSSGAEDGLQASSRSRNHGLLSDRVVVAFTPPSGWPAGKSIGRQAQLDKALGVDEHSARPIGVGDHRAGVATLDAFLGTAKRFCKIAQFQACLIAATGVMLPSRWDRNCSTAKGYDGLQSALRDTNTGGPH